MTEKSEPKEVRVESGVKSVYTSKVWMLQNGKGVVNQDLTINVCTY